MRERAFRFLAERVFLFVDERFEIAGVCAAVALRNESASVLSGITASAASKSLRAVVKSRV